MYKIIACDLDETLLDKQHLIPERNIRAIEKARALGVKFVPATGRGFVSVARTLKDLGLYDKEQEYVISFNGGAITENKDSRLLHFDGLDFDVADQLYRRGQAYDVCIHVYTKDTVYAWNITPQELTYLSGNMDITVTAETTLDFLRGQEVVKVLYMNQDREYLQQIERDLSDITQDVDVSYSSNRYIEFNHKGVTKGNGLLALARLLGVEPSETIAIGDNFNDLSMIRAAGLGVGVQNTVPAMKQDCDFITDATNDEGAVGEVIERFILGHHQSR